MNSALLTIFAWVVVLTLIAAALVAAAHSLRAKKAEEKDDTETVISSMVKQDTRLDREGAFREIIRLRDGGKLDESFIESLSAEERALFEIALIDALTEWTRDDQHKLRSTLIKYGYDDQCARRLMKDSISSSVRASTLLALLRPQSKNNSSNTDRYKKTASGEGGRYS